MHATYIADGCSAVQVSAVQVPDNVRQLDIFWEIPLLVTKRKSCPFFQCYLHQQDVLLGVLMAPLNSFPFDQSGSQRAAFFLFAFSQDTKLALKFIIFCSRAVAACTEVRQHHLNQVLLYSLHLLIYFTVNFSIICNCFFMEKIGNPSYVISNFG